MRGCSLITGLELNPKVLAAEPKSAVYYVSSGSRMRKYIFELVIHFL